MPQNYSRREACRLLNLTERQLRSWEKQDLVPVRQTYGFADLLALRTLIQLRKSRVSPLRIRRAVQALREKLTQVDDPLVEFKIFSEGKRVIVRLGRETIEPVSGQLLLDFSAADVRRLVSFPPEKTRKQELRRRDHDRAVAEKLFEEALEAESRGAVREAMGIYEKVIELDPGFAGAFVNLGTLHFTARNLEQAERLYREAVKADPEYPLAHFNLGNLYDEMGKRDEALREYEVALRLHPSYADAHYNIALLHQAAGRFLQAVHHWKCYLKLDPGSPWSAIARRDLHKLYRAMVLESG